jgi:hypothetical protein
METVSSPHKLDTTMGEATSLRWSGADLTWLQGSGASPLPLEGLLLEPGS